MTRSTDPTAPFVPHPLTDREYWNAVREHPAVRPMLDKVFATAEALPATPHLPQASDYLAAKRFNQRHRTDHFWQNVRPQLGALVLRRCVLGLDENDPDDRLLDWLWGTVTQPSWVVAAHLPGNDLPAAGKAQHDLAACEMAAILSETLEVLHPWIDSVSTTFSQTIIHEIDRRVLTPFLDLSGHHWWAYEEKSSHRNNWTGVCAGSILVACEALARVGQPRPEARERALRLLRIFFDEAFTEHGECDEGAGYWNYGVGVACLGLMRLSPDEVRQKIDMDRLRQIAAYPGQTHLFDNYFYAGNDAPMHARASIYFVPWLAAMTGDPFLAYWLRGISKPSERSTPMALRTIHVLFNGHHTPDAPERYTHPPVREVPDQQVIIVQPPAGPQRMTTALAGGHNHERHNHNDLGHFIVAIDERIIIPDIGAPKYPTDFFGPRRYTYLPASSRGHCCPIINGHEQRAGIEAAGVVLERVLSEQSPRYRLDLTAAYPPEVGLRRWIRSLQADSTAVVIEDDFDCQANSPAPVTHVIWSVVEPVVDGGLLTMDPLTIRLDPAPHAIRVVPVSGESLNLRQFSKQMLYRIEADYAGESIRYRTILKPS